MTSPGSCAPPIGAHVQIRGGLATGGLACTDAVGARAVQVFVGNPRGWRPSAGDPAQDAAFTAGCAERGVPSFIHTPFLVNVGSPSAATVEQSIATIRHNLARGAQLGVQGVVVHAGSAVGADRYYCSRACGIAGATAIVTTTGGDDGAHEGHRKADHCATLDKVATCNAVLSEVLD